VEFPPGATSVEVPFELSSSHIYVDVEINGQGPFHFIFDTGAVNMLTPQAAQRLGLTVSGNVEATGTGGRQDAGKTEVKSVAVGGVALRDQGFYVVELSPTETTGRVVDGLIGQGWLSELPTRIDYAASKITFYPAKGFRYAGAAQATPLYFRGNRSQVEASVDGIAGKFTVDTGSSGSLILFPAFVDKNGLVAKYRPKTQIMSAVAGPVYSLLARADRLEFAGATIEHPVTYLSQARSGAAMDEKTGGSLGSGVLRRFTITFDYPGKKAYFEPNAAIAAPDLADRSGLRVDAAPGGFKVVFVAKDSPAMRANLKAGDIIHSVDERSADGIGLPAFRESLKGAVGTRVTFELVGGNGPTVLELADL
jgi:predicted aspartyl protease